MFQIKLQILVSLYLKSHIHLLCDESFFRKLSSFLSASYKVGVVTDKYET